MKFKKGKNERRLLMLMLALGGLLTNAIWASSVTISWAPNTESDLAGYKVHYGTQSGVYSQIRNVGNATSVIIDSLQVGLTYYFAVTAYDTYGNESEKSAEVSYEVTDNIKPEIDSVYCAARDEVHIVFSEPVDKSSSEYFTNYQIENSSGELLAVLGAKRQSDLRTVYLSTSSHSAGNYIITVNNVKDTASVNNSIVPNSQATYSWIDDLDQEAPGVVSVILDNGILKVTFDEAVSFGTATNPDNYVFSPDVTISNIYLNRDYKVVSMDIDDHVSGQTYDISISNIEDAAGNLMTSYNDQYTCPSSDTQPPKLLSATLNDQSTLILVFDEILNKILAETVANYSIDSGISVQSAQLSTNGTIVTLTTSIHLDGNYNVEVNNIGDDEQVPNVMSSAQSAEYSYESPDTDPPQLDSVKVAYNNVIWLTFNERLDATSATNEYNYSISSNIQVISATLGNSEKRVMLYTDPHVRGDYTVTVTGVKDLTENTIQTNNSLDYSYNPPDQTKPVLLSAELLYQEMWELVFSEPLDPISSTNLNNYSVDNGIMITGATLVGDSSNTVQLKTSSHAQGYIYTISVSGVMDQAATPNMMVATDKTFDFAEIDDISPRLVSAVLLGTSTLKLTFNEPLDVGTAETESNYQISSGIGVDDASLDESGKTVYLFTDAHLGGQSYTVTVQNIKDKATSPNTILADGVENVEIYACPSEDKPPELQRAQIETKQSVKVIFNEPVDPTSAQDINNYQISPYVAVSSASINNSQMEVTLETGFHKAGQKYTIYVNNIKDLAQTPNTIAANSSKTYTYTPADTFPPVLQDINVLSETAIELVFSETIDPSSAKNIANYFFSNGIAIVSVSCDNNIVTLITSSHESGIEYEILVQNITDSYGNTFESATFQYKNEKDDYTRPKIENAYLWEMNNILVVTYDEAMDTLTATDPSNYVISGNVDVNQVLQISSKKYYLSTSEHQTGNYILTVHGVKDASENKNAIQPYSQFEYSWNPPDTTGPELLNATLDLESMNKVTLTFDEAIDKDDAVIETNYSIEPYVKINDAIHSSDENVVYLFTEVHPPDNYRITVSNVHDKAFNPNMIGEKNSQNYEYAPPDTTAPTLENVDISSSPMLLKLTFDEAINAESAENKANYSISPPVNISDVTLKRNDNKYNQILLETEKHEASKEYTITITGIKDRAPVPNVIDVITWEYSYSPEDTTGPKIVDANLHGNSTLEVLFSEKVDQTSAETRDNYKIDPGVEILSVELDTTNYKKVWMVTTSHMPGRQYAITGRNIHDVSSLGNVMRSGNWVYYQLSDSDNLADDDAPDVARVEVLSSTEMDIIFSEPVDVSSASNKSNYAIDDGVVIQSVKIDTGDVRIHLKTTPHNLERLYKLTVKNIKDKADNANELTSTDPLSYLITPTLAVSHLNKLEYDLAAYKENNTGYVDRNYTLESIPEDLEDAVQVKTANDDKESTDHNHLSFEINNDATVYVAYDKNIKEIPGWMRTWKATGEQIVDSRENVYNIYKKDFQDGQIVLGGNYGSMDDNMYQVFVVPQITNGNILAVMNRTNYQTAHIYEGDDYYIDRDYTVAAIPDTLKNLLWLKTANDDKTADDVDFLKLYLKQSALIHIGYDARVKSLPSWLNEWTLLEEAQIVDSRGMKFNVYQKEFAKGEVVLGGNEGTMDDNMYTVMVRSLGPSFGGEVPTSGTFTLSTNYPNPFNPRTTIPFYIHKEGRVQLKVFNILGQQVKVLFDKEVEAGYYGEAIWDGTNERGLQVATGMYFYRIEQKNFAKTKRMLLIR